jgi:hypothetical protein
VNETFSYVYLRVKPSYTGPSTDKHTLFLCSLHAAQYPRRCGLPSEEHTYISLSKKDYVK